MTTSLKLLYRARYLMLLVCGEDHPEMALLDVSYPPLGNVPLPRVLDVSYARPSLSSHPHLQMV